MLQISRRRVEAFDLLLFPCSWSYPYTQEFLVLHELAEVELFPLAPFRIVVLSLDPRRIRVARRRLELRRVAQPERAVHQQRRAHAEALADEQQPRLLADIDRAAPEEGRKID